MLTIDAAAMVERAGVYTKADAVAHALDWRQQSRIADEDFWDVEYQVRDRTLRSTDLIAFHREVSLAVRKSMGGRR